MLWMAKVARDKGIDAALRPQPYEFGRDAQEGAGGEKRLRRQIGEGALVDALRIGQKSAIGGDITRLEFRDLRLIPGGVAVIIEPATVAKVDAIKRVQRHEWHIVLQAASGTGPEVFQQVRRGQQRRPHIEGETIVSAVLG